MATKFCEISTLILSVCTLDKSKMEISQSFVAFSEYTNFKCLYPLGVGNELKLLNFSSGTLHFRYCYEPKRMWKLKLTYN